MIKPIDVKNRAVEPAKLANRAPRGVRTTSIQALGEDGIVDLATYPGPHVTVDALAAYWGVSRRTIIRDVYQRKLRASQLPGGRLRIRIEDARSYGKPIE